MEQDHTTVCQESTSRMQKHSALSNKSLAGLQESTDELNEPIIEVQSQTSTEGANEPITLLQEAYTGSKEPIIGLQEPNIEFDPVEELTNSIHSSLTLGNENVSEDISTMVAIIDSLKEYPTDPYHFRETPVTPALVRAILEVGPCQPGLKDDFNNFPKDINGRKFLTDWYEKKVGESGIKVSRQWLIYSPKANSMFYLPCWLFSKSPGIRGAPNGGCKFFKNGLYRTHKSAEKNLLLNRYRLFNDKTIIKSSANMEMKEIENNRKILASILDSIFYLTKQG